MSTLRCTGWRSVALGVRILLASLWGHAGGREWEVAKGPKGGSHREAQGWSEVGAGRPGWADVLLSRRACVGESEPLVRGSKQAHAGQSVDGVWQVALLLWREAHLA